MAELKGLDRRDVDAWWVVFTMDLQHQALHQQPAGNASTWPAAGARACYSSRRTPPQLPSSFARNRAPYAKQAEMLALT